MSLNTYQTRGKNMIYQVPTQDAQQQAFLSQYIQNLMQQQAPSGNYGLSQDYLSGILSGDPEAYNQFAAPYLQQFQEQILPALNERYAGIGGGLGGGVGSSSGFGQAIGGAASSLQAQLANLYANLRKDAASQGMAQYNLQSQLGLGTRPFENIYQPKARGLASYAGAGIGQGAGQALGQVGTQYLFNQLLGQGQNQGQLPQGTGGSGNAGFNYGMGMQPGQYGFNASYRY